MIAFHYVEGSSWDSFSIERYIALIMWAKSAKKNVLFVSKLHILLPIWAKDLLRINWEYGTLIVMLFQ